MYLVSIIAFGSSLHISCLSSLGEGLQGCPLARLGPLVGQQEYCIVNLKVKLDAATDYSSVYDLQKLSHYQSGKSTLLTRG